MDCILPFILFQRIFHEIKFQTNEYIKLYLNMAYKYMPINFSYKISRNFFFLKIIA